MRAKVKEVTKNRVRAVYENEIGDLRDRTFAAPLDGGYVYEIDKNGGTFQVCDYLANSGPTLIWSPQHHGNFIDYIRREFKRMRRQERSLINNRLK
jgi:hypothetical protein